MFCLEYIKDFNATGAAKRAGYSDKTSYSQGHDLLKKPEIQEAITAATSRRIEKVEVDAAWVLTESIDLYKECRMEGDRTQANKALDTVGKHVDVKAWDKTVTVEASDALVSILEEARKRATGA